MADRVFAIAAHPDDIEFVMAGTMLRLRQSGYELHYLNIANGCCGSTVTDAQQTAMIRRGEALESCRKLGGVFHESLTNDLEIFYDRETLFKLASLVRLVSPRIVLTHAPLDYMEDHMNACRLATTAAFSRGMPNFPVDPPRYAVGGNVTVYHAQPHGNRDPLGNTVTPTHFVDVSDLLDEKTSFLACHKSQKEWLDTSQGLDSYLHAMHALCREVGEMSGTFRHAEGWRKHLHLGFCGPQEDPLAAALAGHCLVRG